MWLNIFVGLDTVYLCSEVLIAWTCDDTEDNHESRIVNAFIMMCHRTGEIFQSCARGKVYKICDSKLQVTNYMNTCTEGQIVLPQSIPMMIKLDSVKEGMSQR